MDFLIREKMVKSLKKIKDPSKFRFAFLAMFELATNGTELDRSILDMDNLDDERIDTFFDSFEDEVKNTSDRFLQSVESGKKAMLKPAHGYKNTDFDIKGQVAIRNYPLEKLNKIKEIIEKDIEKGICGFTFDEFIEANSEYKTNNVLTCYKYNCDNGLYQQKQPSKPKTTTTPTHTLPKQKKEPEHKVYTTDEMVEILLKKDGLMTNIGKDTYRVKDNRIFKHTQNGYKDFDFNKETIKIIFDGWR